METNILVEKVKMLPAPLKKEVEDFVDFLIYKDRSDKNRVSSYDVVSGFGGAKGIITYMSDDFDEPLEDFKEYM